LDAKLKLQNDERERLIEEEKRRLIEEYESGSKMEIDQITVEDDLIEKEIQNLRVELKKAENEETKKLENTGIPSMGKLK
jgi:hypothetical protein